ncbi:dTDP-4-amino-4,6-dideoxygalactose transaminase [Pseudaminobacter salicylatoxidans]|uniref:dTDP-4-amino-4,6-dideoxygalactose transaminase n=1 Tax=Pseudaminobacter salicylatoxidans TaxID=93369 RepID=A0A316C1I0_PSESE|nr:DegT/DnrJ/EryC1/StrS aminotransferase family protein [Pseudaminobacter salicylatoxidans]PWJ82326.1 dTDP-4-amino-4,6-dideoxygalactose transaminase [Pseudaminobacter salicylatoxidans]
MTIPFIDIQAQRGRIGDAIDAAILQVTRSGQFVMGPQVHEFEAKLAAFGNARHALSCSNGTDSLMFLLMAWGVGPGDAVFCPSFTFAATAEVVALLGAIPVFVDIDPSTYNIDAVHLEATIEATKREGRFTPRVIIAVDLFGQPADYPALATVAHAHGLKLLADTAQGFGCRLHGKHPLHWADASSLSFFPAKPLGAYGDGGAILTDDDELHDVLSSIRVHGQATPRDAAARGFEHDPKYLNMRLGSNGRLDTIQAAVLIEKLTIFEDEIARRNKIAARYSNALAPHVARVPEIIVGAVPTWAQYTIEHEDRDGLAAHLKSQGIPTAVYYPIPVHQQPAYNCYPVGPGGLPVTENKASRVISLPMSPYLDDATQDAIVVAVKSYG